MPLPKSLYPRQGYKQKRALPKATLGHMREKLTHKVFLSLKISACNLAGMACDASKQECAHTGHVYFKTIYSAKRKKERGKQTRPDPTRPGQSRTVRFRCMTVVASRVLRESLA